MLKYRIVQDNVILHDGLTQEEAQETLIILKDLIDLIVILKTFRIYLWVRQDTLSKHLMRLFDLFMSHVILLLK